MRPKFFTVVALAATLLLAFVAYTVLTDYLYTSGDFGDSAVMVAAALVAVVLPFAVWLGMSIKLTTREQIMLWAAKCSVVMAAYMVVLPWVVELLSGNNHISVIAVFWLAATVMGFIAYTLKNFSQAATAA